MHIDTIDKDTLQLIRLAIEVELERLNKDFTGIEIKLGRGRFDSTQCTWKLQVTQTEKAYAQAKSLLEVNLAQLNRQGENSQWVAIDYRPRNRKMPFILKNKSTGSTVKCASGWILNNMPKIELPPIETVTPRYVDVEDGRAFDLNED